MKRFSLRTLVAQCGGQLYQGINPSSADFAIPEVATDSRQLNKGALFVALPGERFDGHNFVAELADTMGAALVRRDWFAQHGHCYPQSYFVVTDNTATAFLAWGKAHAQAWRRTNAARRLIALSGSNGKTSTKDMIASILRAEVGEHAVLSTQGNLNNTVGLPLTLLRLTDAHRFAVVELGINAVGEMAVLSRNLPADAVFITNAGRVHLEGFGDSQTVAREKGLLYGTLSDEGLAFINADDTHHPLWLTATKACRQMLVHPHEVAIESTHIAAQTIRINVVIDDRRESLRINLPVLGRHQAGNALCAGVIASTLNGSANAIVRGLEGVVLTQGRLRVHTHPHYPQVRLIDDTYNANPESMKMAINTLAEHDGQTILAMGDMGELGTNALSLHEEVLLHALKAKLTAVYVLGEWAHQAVKNLAHSPDQEKIYLAQSHDEMATLILDRIRTAAGQKVTILAKGSRFMGMEKVVGQILAQS